jgi:DNA polymerase-3 subunit chi
MQQVTVHFNVVDKIAYSCRLLRKVWQGGGRALVRGPADVLDALDEALWSFSSTDFVPHAKCVGESMVRAPIVLDANLMHTSALPLVVNLGDADPKAFEAFEQLIDVIGMDGQDLQSGRERWRRYRDMGWTVTSHDMGHWVAA